MSANSKKLGTTALAALVVSAMIGRGIFSMPQNITQNASVLTVATAWLISGIGIFFLANVFRILAEVRPDEKLNSAFEQLPIPAMTPWGAYMEMFRGNTELVPANRLANRIAVNALIPSPPGILMVISGERFGEADNPHFPICDHRQPEIPSFPVLNMLQKAVPKLTVFTMCRV